MKKIVLIRHAKSSWDNSGLDDFERPLNPRGMKDAPEMSNILIEKIQKPDLIITSSAVRALTTANFFASAFNYPEENIIKDKTIYLASRQKVLEIVSKIDSKNDLIFLIGHNPTITELASFLSNATIDNLPTCAAVGIEFETNKWENISKSNSKLIFFEYPKKYNY